ncbi:UMTA methyltransferase family protein [Rasamsonia emersonii CBS 393.64]|uniref:UMTA methyltransferase family protein n=1 Tax=Rasamsonia emersonii (strain ATCC 16479 / CBS 393.64 / IMI 116815) TaxID=1408163 RepID=A0A0F4Z624_RASE3|nr:UMTA methyltransferase family protein [Rasamsonia emersonii CBS 393.64]KKA25952.1 UMTA methyltransferase family protein [Rasamsonia emersonii CBS 393.64]
MDRKLYLAPLKSPQRVIDLGTGTGIWAIDFGMCHPIKCPLQRQVPSPVSCHMSNGTDAGQVIGCDLSPTQPNMVPPNVKFLVDDIEADWEYGNNPFDFIHARYLSVSIKNFPRLVRQCYRYAKPGGWVEFQDWDSRITSEDNSTKGTSIKRYYNEVLGAFERNGYETSPGPHLEQWFRDAGFVDVQKKVGTWCMLQAEQGFEAGGLAVLTRFENWSKEDVVDLAKKAVADAHNRNIHPLFNFYVVYGRKPE